MSLYIGTSALLKLYVEEAGSDACEEFLAADSDWVAARHTLVEARRNLWRLLQGPDHAGATAQFAQDWQRFRVIELAVNRAEMAAILVRAHDVRAGQAGSAPLPPAPDAFPDDDHLGAAAAIDKAAAAGVVAGSTSGRFAPACPAPASVCRGPAGWSGALTGSTSRVQLHV